MFTALQKHKVLGTFYSTYGHLRLKPWVQDCKICSSPTEEVDENSRHLGHTLVHSFAGGSILLELEHLKSQKNVFILSLMNALYLLRAIKCIISCLHHIHFNLWPTLKFTCNQNPCLMVVTLKLYVNWINSAYYYQT